MTVEELIKRLLICNQEAEAYICTGDINLTDIDDVTQETPAMVVIS
jgi:hypothetical protein